MLRTKLLAIAGGCLFFCITISNFSVTNANSRTRRARFRHDINLTTTPSTSLDDDIQPTSRRQCDLNEIEYRLTKLEVQVAEISGNVRSEMRQINHQLQGMDYKGDEIYSNIEGLRNDYNRLLEFNRGGFPRPQRQDISTKLESNVDNLSRGMQLVVTALRAVNNDLVTMSRNISLITNTTRKLLQDYDHLATKDFLIQSLNDMKHHSQSIFMRPWESCQHQQQEIRAESALPRNCWDVQQKKSEFTRFDISGFYLIQPETNTKPFMVLCDMESNGGGWTVIHNRFDGSQDFYLNWHSYKHGFGNLGGEFWLGLEKIHQLTGSQVNELLVELVDVNQENATAHYSAFSVGNEMEGYPLKILAGYSGTAGDSLNYHGGSKFSTKDMDQDNWSQGNCAQAHTGAWWYKECDTSNLNGRYFKGELPAELLYQGMYWGEFRGAQYSLLNARMMIRPKNENSPPIYPKGG